MTKSRRNRNHTFKNPGTVNAAICGRPSRNSRHTR